MKRRTDGEVRESIGRSRKPAFSRRFCDEQIAGALARYKAGEATISIARDLGCDHSLICYWARRAGIRRKLVRSMRAGELDASVRATMVDEYVRGGSPSVIGRKYRVAASAVVQAARRAGHPPRHRMTAQARDEGWREEDWQDEERSPAPASVPASSCSAVRVRELADRGMGLTAIAAQLRAPYREVAAALGMS